jgi:adenine deaminase
MTLSFLGRAVVCSLKITDKGLVEVEQFTLSPLFPE